MVEGTMKNLSFGNIKKYTFRCYTKQCLEMDFLYIELVTWMKQLSF